MNFINDFLHIPHMNSQKCLLWKNIFGLKLAIMPFSKPKNYHLTFELKAATYFEWRGKNHLIYLLYGGSKSKL